MPPFDLCSAVAGWRKETYDDMQATYLASTVRLTYLCDVSSEGGSIKTEDESIANM